MATRPPREQQLASQTLKSKVTNELGAALVSGKWAPGEILQLDSLAGQFAVSLSVIREAVSVLSAMGLVESRRRLGTIVQPAANWDQMNPQLIGWKLADPHQREDQFRWLIELREALEPAAASLAALNRTQLQADTLNELATDLRECSERADLEGFLRSDVKYHQELYRASANPQIAQMANQMQVVLTARHQFDLMPRRPDARAVELHALLARSIREFDVETAAFANSQIVKQASEEFHQALRRVR